MPVKPEVTYTTSRDVAEGYDERFADSNDTLFRLDTAFIEEHLPETCRSMIDLGCGTGRHIVHFAKPLLLVVGIDLNPHMLKVAAGKLGGRHHCVDLEVGDIARPFGTSSRYRGAFHAAICMFNALECLPPPDQSQAIKAAYNLLRPGGIYIFQVHNGNVGKKVRKGGHKGEPSVPLYLLSETDVRALLEEAGFEVKELRYIAANRAEYDESENAPRTAYGMIVAATKP